MRAMISQPLRGKTDEEIEETRESAYVKLRDMGYSEIVVPTAEAKWPVKGMNPNDGALFSLGHSLQVMATCDAVLFCKGWMYARGCQIEHQAAKEYGKKILYEVCSRCVEAQ